MTTLIRYLVYLILFLIFTWFVFIGATAMTVTFLSIYMGPELHKVDPVALYFTLMGTSIVVSLLLVAVFKLRFPSK